MRICADERQRSSLLRRLRAPLAVSLLLAATVVALFWPLGASEFIDFDDNVYVTDNALVRSGVSFAGLRRAFLSTDASNWHPATWLSHMLDVELFGLDAGAHHLVNVTLHAGSAVLLFLVLRGMTGTLWRSAVVAALFAVHPLHVESIAWVSERKDVLCALFWLAAMAAYLRYVHHPGRRTYFAVAGLFTLGLMAKPMAVTLPAALLLLDYWPLGRFRSVGPRPARVLAEKIPLFILAALSSAVTLYAQQRGGVVQTLRLLPFPDRLQNAVVSCGVYLGAALWPAKLAIFYPLPSHGYPGWQVATAAAVLTLLLILAVRAARAFPAGFVGGCWFLGLLVPAIGLVQVGEQVRADRYTYLPLVGLFIAAVWGANALLPRRGALKALATLLVLAAVAAACSMQVGFWRDSTTLFTHARAVAPESAAVENNLGLALSKRGEVAEAAFHFQQALRIKPDLAAAHFNLGLLLLRSERRAEAETLFRRAVELDPHSAEMRNSLGHLLESQGRHEEAIVQLMRAVQIRPDDADANNNLGVALARTGRMAEARDYFSRAARLAPADQEVRENLDRAREQNGAAP